VPPYPYAQITQRGMAEIGISPNIAVLEAVISVVSHKALQILTITAIISQALGQSVTYGFDKLCRCQLPRS